MRIALRIYAELDLPLGSAVPLVRSDGRLAAAEEVEETALQALSARFGDMMRYANAGAQEAHSWHGPASEATHIPVTCQSLEGTCDEYA